MHRRSPTQQAAAMLVRLLLALVVNALALVTIAGWVDGLRIDSSALLVAVVIAAANAVLAVAMLRLSMRLVVYSLGLASLAGNVAAVLLAAELVPGFEVDGWEPAVLVGIALALVSTVASIVLSLDGDATFMRAAARQAARRLGTASPTDAPGTVFLEIDGCSYGVLQRAMRAGWMPELSRWLDEGYRLERWHTGLSSQTGASQAGLLLGSCEGIVAFRWYDREQGRVVVTSSPHDAHEIEQRLSTGDGLLAGGGASRNNIFSGDAAEASITLSTLADRGGASKVWGPFFLNPGNVLRTVLLVVADIVSEVAWSLSAWRRDIQPRLRKGWRYPLVRAATTVVMRDLATEMVVGDMVRGIPSVYVTFVGYDEVAHHDGVERLPALQQLRLLDRTIGRIQRAAVHAPRPYRFVVLSDHGQSQGATFLQRYGITLEDLVRGLADGATVDAHTREEESVTQLNAALPASISIAGDGRNSLRTEPVAEADLVVLASGSLGLVYLAGGSERLDRAALDARLPGLVDGLVAHPGIGWVLVDDGHGGTVIGQGGSLRLADGTVDGSNPLDGHGPHALELVRRHARMRNLPDVLVMARWDPQRGEVPAFEELIGSHGGMGGEQGEPFVLFPGDLPWPEDHDVVGADHLHRILRAWARDHRVVTVQPDHSEAAHADVAGAAHAGGAGAAAPAQTTTNPGER